MKLDMKDKIKITLVILGGITLSVIGASFILGNWEFLFSVLFVKTMFVIFILVVIGLIIGAKIGSQFYVKTEKGKVGK